MPFQLFCRTAVVQSHIIHSVSPVHPGLPLSPGKPHFTGVYWHITNTKPSPAALEATEQRSRHRAGGRNPEDGFYCKTDSRDTAVPCARPARPPDLWAGCAGGTAQGGRRVPGLTPGAGEPPARGGGAADGARCPGSRGTMAGG